MFWFATEFNQDLSKWDVTSNTSYMEMFRGAYSFNSDLSSWNTSAGVDFFGIFVGASSFNGDVTTWDVSNVSRSAGFGIGLTGFFYFATEFDQDTSGWNVSNHWTLRAIFTEARKFNQDLSTWKVGNCFDTAHFLMGAESFNQDLCAWKHDFQYAYSRDIFAFSGCTYTEEPVMEQQGPFCASMCEITNKPFQENLELREAIEAYVDQDCANDTNCEIGQAYGYPMNDWDVSHVTDFSYLFCEYSSLSSCSPWLSPLNLSHDTHTRVPIN